MRNSGSKKTQMRKLIDDCKSKSRKQTQMAKSPNKKSFEEHDPELGGGHKDQHMTHSSHAGSWLTSVLALFSSFGAERARKDQLKAED
ncbi:hypothetical protein ACET3Z_003548 [Daucus carota]